jgi:hypothetical protein
MYQVKVFVCTCSQCKGVKNKRHKARKKIKRMINKKRRKMKLGEVYNFYYA